MKQVAFQFLTICFSMNITAVFAANFLNEVKTHHTGVYGLNGDCSTSSKASINVLRDYIEIKNHSAPVKKMYFDGFCGVGNCGIEAPNSPHVSFKSSLVAHPKLRGEVADPLNETSIEFYDTVPNAITLENGAPPKFHDRTRSEFKNLYGLQFKRCVGKSTANFTPGVAPQEIRPTWRLDSESKIVSYGLPETTALMKLECKSPNKFVFSVFDPSDKSRQHRSREATIIAGSAYEPVKFTVKSSDGDILIFDLRRNSVALDRMESNGFFQISLPTGEAILVDGTSAAPTVKQLLNQCQTVGSDKSMPVQKAADANTGWWVVLASGAATPDRATNGGDMVDQLAQRCGIRTFNDWSAKFPNFKPGHNLHVLLGSPYGNREFASKALQTASPCFPDAYIKFGSYLGE